TKRVERQSEMFGTLAKTHLVTRLLPAIDMLYDASRHLNDQGLVITIQTLEESLKDEGVEKIQPAPGNVFEDHLHEAIEAVNDPQKENGEIVEVVLAGWK